jgi:YaiO family outer membrane protein
MKSIKYLITFICIAPIILSHHAQAEINDLENSLKISYERSTFNKILDDWNLYEIEYTKKLPSVTLISRVLNAYRYNEQGNQYEMDVYPFKKGSYYFYVNLGFSDADIFPDKRIGFEIYKVFQRSLELSAGFRHIIYSDDAVTLYTSSLWKYLGNYLVSPRIFYSPQDIGSSTSYILEIRRYMTRYIKMITLKTGYGVSPEDAYNLEIIQLKTYFAFLSIQKNITGLWDFEIQGEIKQEEIRDNYFRQKNTVKLSIGRVF